MGLLEFPDPVSWYEGAKNSQLERSSIDALSNMVYSAQITFLWNSGASKWAQWIGEGKAMQAAATAMYLALEKRSKFLALTVPKDMLEADNLAQFQTESKP